MACCYSWKKNLSNKLFTMFVWTNWWNCKCVHNLKNVWLLFVWSAHNVFVWMKCLNLRCYNYYVTYICLYIHESNIYFYQCAGETGRENALVTHTIIPVVWIIVVLLLLLCWYLCPCTHKMLKPKIRNQHTKTVGYSVHVIDIPQDTTIQLPNVNESKSNTFDTYTSQSAKFVYETKRKIIWITTLVHDHYPLNIAFTTICCYGVCVYMYRRHRHRQHHSHSRRE